MVSQWIDYYKNHSGKNYLVQKKYEYTENPTIQGMWHPFVNVEPEIATAKFPVVMLNITTKTFPENWDSKAPSVGTLLAYLVTMA